MADRRNRGQKAFWKTPWTLCLSMSVLLMAMNMAQAQIERIDPPNWWVGFRDPALQLMVRGDGIGSFTPKVGGTQVKLLQSHKADSPNYLFLDLEIPEDTPPGEILLTFSKEGEPDITYSYALERRPLDPAEYTGFLSTDVIYLITPDRFANGDPSNDIIPGLREQKVNRKDDYARHGGDIRGMTNHLDYIADLGFTAIWPSPLLINDMPGESYHGYAITDFYQVDPRFGTMEEYVELSAKAREKGMKLIMDQVSNHCGLYHWWMQDLPFSDWINYQKGFEEGRETTVTNHRRTVNQDLYASEHDRELMDNGWFVPSMPDLNQENPFMAQYLIQNSIWWIEKLALGGIRQDTYPYPDKEFMARWAKRIMTEYPSFSIVGEEWSYNPLVVGYWQRGALNRDGYESHLRSTMDFPLQQTLVDALVEEENWNTGLIKLYEGLANDFHYPAPRDMMLFGDNHDMDRLFTQLREDVVLTQMALAFIMVAPRIPQFYYGTEILMENSDKPGDHGKIRTDFPGGWPRDKVNAFTGKGLSARAREMQQFVKTLVRFRKEQEVIHLGQTRHFSPENGVYVLFRYLGEKKIVLVLNKNEKPVTLDLNRFREMGLADSEFKEVLGGKTLRFGNGLVLEQKGVLLFVN